MTMSISILNWVTNGNVGTYRVSNNCSIPLTVYDSAPSLGPVSFSVVSGSIPNFLNLDSSTGYLYGYLEYQSKNIETYTFTVEATKTYPNSLTTSTSTQLSITVKNFVDENIEWVTSSTLGIIDAGFVSDLSVQAVETINNTKIKYDLVSGNLPNGFNLDEEGSILGQADYESTGTFTFTVRANTDLGIAVEERIFTLTVVNNDPGTKYTKIWFRPFLSKSKRSEYQLFINDFKIFEPNLIYRHNDPNFGVQSEIKMILDFGIEQIPLDQYTQALRQNFYKRRFTLGKVKTAVASDKDGNVIYEVIYLDVVDNLKTAAETLYTTRNISESLSGSSAGQILSEMPLGFGDDTVDDIYYPASVKNMRMQLTRIQLDNFAMIKVNRFMEPQFMRTPQPGTALPSNYIPVVVLCYAKPGQSEKILKKIAARGFKFNMIDFEIDRMIVQTSLDYSSAKYLLFGRESISDTLDIDPNLYQGDVLWQFDDGVQLTRTS